MVGRRRRCFVGGATSRRLAQPLRGSLSSCSPGLGSARARLRYADAPGRSAVGAIACAAAGGWAFTTPAFQVGDEPQHVAYAQYLLETGKPPRIAPGPCSLLRRRDRLSGRGRQPRRRQRRWDGPVDRRPGSSDRRRARSRSGSLERGRGIQPGQQPAALLRAHRVCRTRSLGGGDFLDRLLAMRLLSVAACRRDGGLVLLFLRELLPGRPWALAAGALRSVSAAAARLHRRRRQQRRGALRRLGGILWLVARALRRGLDTRTALGIGVALGLGVVTKPTILMRRSRSPRMCRGVLLSRADGTRRALRGSCSRRHRGCSDRGYLVLNAAVWDRTLWTRVDAAERPPASGERPRGARVPVAVLPAAVAVHVRAAGRLPLYDVWFKGFIGSLGWLDTVFPSWVYRALGRVRARSGPRRECALA